MRRHEERERRPRDRVGIATLVGFLLFILLLLAGFSFIHSEVHWDGSFAQSEYQVALQDTDGKPLSGVQLRVEDEEGNPACGYPVTDYFPPNAPKSGADGVMVFHHVRLGQEFGGRERRLLWLLPMGEHESPRYVCRFFHDGREVLRIPFRDLNRARRGSGAEVTREWDWATCGPVEADGNAEREAVSLEPDWSTKEGEGIPTIERQAVRNARLDMYERREELRKQASETREELTFPVHRLETQTVAAAEGEERHASAE